MNSPRNVFFQHRWLFLIAFLSLLLKGVFFTSGSIVNSDGALYIASAVKYGQGLYSEAQQYYPMPFYPLLLTGLHALWPDWIIAGKLLSFLPLWLTLFPLYGLTQRLFDSQVALWTALLFAVLPAFNESGADIKRDPLFLFFFVTALFFLVVFFQQCRRRHLLCFIFLAILATLVRIEGILLVLVALIAFPFCRQLRVRVALLFKMLLSGVFLLIVLIAVLWCFKRYGLSFFSRLEEISLWAESLLQRNFFGDYRHLMEVLKSLQETLPGADLHNNLIEVTRHYAPVIYLLGMIEMLVKGMFPTSLIALWGHWQYGRGEKVRARRILGFMGLAFILLNLLFNMKMNFTTERYLWIPIVLMLPWLGNGLVAWLHHLRNRKALPFLVSVVVLLAPLSKTVSLAARDEDRTVVRAGRWLNEYDPGQQYEILYNDRRLPLYAGRVLEVNRVMPLNALSLLARENKQIELVAIYFSNKEKQDVSVVGFKQLKELRGREKTVLFLRRSSQGGPSVSVRE